MAIFLLWTGLSFDMVDFGSVRMGMIITGVYLFAAVYSPGAGPVPVTYAAEAFPLSVRPLGMSFATGTTWGANFLLALTWPLLLSSIKPIGAFSLYAAFCVIGTVAILCFVPETRKKTLEELDKVFDVALGRQIRYGWSQLAWLVACALCLPKRTAPTPPARVDEQQGGAPVTQIQAEDKSLPMLGRTESETTTLRTCSIAPDIVPIPR